MSISVSDPSWRALVIDDEAPARAAVSRCLEVAGAAVASVATGAEALAKLKLLRFAVIFLDLGLGKEDGLRLLPALVREGRGASIIILSGTKAIPTVVAAVNAGALDYVTKPFSAPHIRDVALVGLARHRSRVEAEEAVASAAYGDAFASFVTRCPAMERLFERALCVAPDMVPVLIRGESGTGKNEIARWMHVRSGRGNGPFVTVLCPSLTVDLMNSLLFGHVKGSFTGATGDTRGKVQHAHRGTLVFDEVADLPIPAQAPLLRYMHDGCFDRVGDPAEHRSDTRIMSATNRDIEAMIATGLLRDDLFYRLDGVTLWVPPLRDRGEDVLGIARAELLRCGLLRGQGDLAFTPEAEQLIRAYRWPGNVREMHRVIERGVLFHSGARIHPDDLEIPGTAGAAKAAARIEPGGDVTVEALRRAHIEAVVARCETLPPAAEILGIDVRTLERALARYRSE
jgi:two-component system, NtrC family, response regulator AlgB